MAGGSPVESVDRALLVLQALARAGARGRPLADLAAELGLNKSTVHRALAALRYRDFVTQDHATGAYLLGPAAIGLRESYFADDQLPLLLHPALAALSAETAELVHLLDAVDRDVARSAGRAGVAYADQRHPL